MNKEQPSGCGLYFHLNYLGFSICFRMSSCRRGGLKVEVDGGSEGGERERGDRNKIDFFFKLKFFGIS